MHRKRLTRQAWWELMIHYQSMPDSSDQGLNALLFAYYMPYFPGTISCFYHVHFS